MGFERTLKELPNYTPAQRAAIRAELDRIEGVSNDYQRGYDDGFNAAIKTYWASVQMVNDRFNTLHGAIYFAYGIAAAGYGKNPHGMLRKTAGKIADAKKQLEFEISRVEKATNNHVELITPEADEATEALKLMYNGTDPNGNVLRSIAAKANPMANEIINIIRPQLAPGKKPVEEVNRLCLRISTYKEPGVSLEKAYQMMTDDLRASHETDEDTADWLYVQNWSLDSVTRAYSRWRKPI